MNKTPDQQFIIETDTGADCVENDIIDSLAFVPGGAQLPFSRRNFRALVLHLLYAADSLGNVVTFDSIVDNYNRGFGVDITAASESCNTAREIIVKHEQLDALFVPLLNNWRFDRISVATKLILRIAAYEMVYTKVDHRIIMNEAVELAKRFAEKDAYRFINGILDRLSKAVIASAARSSAAH